ncbi:amino acid ABC transporter [Marinobacterium nitratireducens]|uniref:Amino acid ABC transporter n=1 Tax=Marinobacterium nitratireducens TaxID=518897 RepID=A0A917ZRD8_9GAMM|nr:transporter substrate-binding domain-containing protein [Marinobacterium nitratireducens]GGO89518.1 amino acid ABC transporter [Marinobacterium nitratireducens]
MKFATWLAGAAVAAALVSTAVPAKDWNEIRIGSEGAYPPFNSINSSGELVGFDIDIGKALCEQMQAKCSFVAQDWDGIIPGLLSGKYDVILASMSITEERKQQVAFSAPYYKAAMTWVARTDDEAPEDFSPEGLNGKVLGAQSSTQMAAYLQAVYPKADLRLYRTQDEANMDLANGRIDLMVGDLLPMLDWIEGGEDARCCHMVGEPITDSRYAGEGTGMALRQEDEALRRKLDQALAAIIADGTYQAINDKYFSINIYDLK